MSNSLSRRDFLKLMTIGSTAAAVLTGCGTNARYVTRQPYTEMPEYTLPGKSAYFATTCRECAAGCGLLVRVTEGRAIKIEGNPNHPTSLGSTCARGQTILQGLYNPDRVIEPLTQAERGSDSFGPINWDTAITALKDALSGEAEGEVAFLMGLTPDHLYELASEVTAALGAPAPLRYNALAGFEGRATLSQAVDDLFGVQYLPTFDIAGADLLFSFGADYAETWLSPVAYQRAAGDLRQGRPGRRGFVVHFSSRMSLTAALADKWVPIVPGSEGLVALAIGKLAAEINGLDAAHFADADLALTARQSGLSEDELHILAEMFSRATHPLALPGGQALTHTNGVQNAKAILALNILADNVNKPGGLTFQLTADSNSAVKTSASYAEIQKLIERMAAGQVKTLLIHGVNPLFDLPPSLGFAEALKKVGMVFSFASFLDETALQANYILPDHTALESWGYQNSRGGAEAVISAFQPVVMPLYETRATADLLLAAVQGAGGELAAKVPYADEVQFLQSRVAALQDAGAFYTPTDDRGIFWTEWLQKGGWLGGNLGAKVDLQPSAALQVPNADFDESGDYFLVTYPHPNLGDGSGANFPWLQETPEPMTTVMWDTWIEINPQTAHKFGIHDDDVVRVISEAGEIELPAYLYPAIRPDTLAIPFGNGHSALGQFAEGVGVNPLPLIAARLNEAGDLSLGATRVQIVRTEKTHKLARYGDRVLNKQETH